VVAVVMVVVVMVVMVIMMMVIAIIIPVANTFSVNTDLAFTAIIIARTLRGGCVWHTGIGTITAIRNAPVHYGPAIIVLALHGICRTIDGWWSVVATKRPATTTGNKHKNKEHN